MRSGKNPAFRISKEILYNNARGEEPWPFWS